MLCDLFCRVIDNWGDAGFCWRLANELKLRGHKVRLWIDKPEILSWMAPQCPDSNPNQSIDIVYWSEEITYPPPADILIEAFACNPPRGYIDYIVKQGHDPIWINLEYLSAETAAARNHRLRSPHPSGLRKYFFYPGWLASSGGLLRERDLPRRQQQFNATHWLHANQLTPQNQERCVSLFCYDNPVLVRLLAALQQQPTHLLVAAGYPTQQVKTLLGTQSQVNGLRVSYLPQLNQNDYDHLLWACDVNFVRGEESLVRAQWAQHPYVWQPYFQTDGAHLNKLWAYHQLWQEVQGCISHHQNLNLAWNQLHQSDEEFPWPSQATLWKEWQTQHQRWHDWLVEQSDLCTRLLDFHASLVKSRL